MIDGTLTVNLEPPYLAFCDKAGNHYSRNCSFEEIQDMLADLGNLNWPLRDCFVRIPMQFDQFGLAKWRLNPVQNSKKPVRGQLDLNG